MDSHVLSNHRKTGSKEFCEWSCVHEDKSGLALIEGIVNRGKPRRGLGGDVEVSGGFEVLIDRSGPLEPVLVQFLEVRMTDRHWFLAHDTATNLFRMADVRGESTALE